MPTPTEIWRYQGGGKDSTDMIFGASAAMDSSVFFTGYSSGQWNGSSAGMKDFSAAKIDSEGTLLWAWQEGSEGYDRMYAAVALSDGGVVLGGYFKGAWNEVAAEGAHDFAAVKLDTAGTLVWRWQLPSLHVCAVVRCRGCQAGTNYSEVLHACVQTVDGNVVVAGYSRGYSTGEEIDEYSDIFAVKLDVNTGEKLWTSQAGRMGNGDTIAYAAAARSDGSVVLAGFTFGTSETTFSETVGYSDFAAVAIDEDGNELWRWKDGSDGGNDVFRACTALDDGSVIIAGDTEGDWDGANNGGSDFAVVKLNALGLEEWRWQGGTDLDDYIHGTATTNNGSIVLAGYTRGNWARPSNKSHDGYLDFAAMAMDAEGLQLWSYQDGTDKNDGFNAVAVRPDGFILLAGWTDGNWTSHGNKDDRADYAAVLIDSSALHTPAPELTKSPIPSPIGGASSTPTPAPTWALTPGKETTKGPSDLHSPTSVFLPGTPGPCNVETDTTRPSSTSLGLIVGGVVSGIAVLFTLGVLVAKVIPRSRVNLRADRIRSSPAASRHFPAAAGPGDSTLPPPPTVL